MKPKKKLSTFEREMKNIQFKKTFEKGYKSFLLSELLIALMDRNNKSVRELANEVGLSPSVIQKIRSNEQKDIKITNFLNIVDEFGYKVFLEKGKERILIKNDSRHHINFAHASL
jgi:DNA-binding Xre family transcriptional regulator